MRLNAAQAAQRAQTLLSQGRFRDAAQITAQMYRAKPGGPRIALLHGETMLRAGRARDALAALETAAGSDLPMPHAVAAWTLLGECRGRVGDGDGAVAALDHAVSLRPGDPLAARALTDGLIDAGRLDDAERALGPVIGASPVHPSVAVIYARLKRRQKDPAPAIELLERCEQTPGVLSALGQCLESERRYDEAFDAFERANRAMGVRLDRETHRLRTEHALASLDQVEVRGGGGAPRVVLIVGMPRSGTSLIEQVFASHPEVGACGESQSLPALWRRVCREVTRPFLPSVGADEVLDEGRAYVEDLIAEASREGARVLTDKNPMNLFLLGVAARALPGLRVIRCRRAAMDVCVSCYTSPLGPDHEYACDLGDCAEYFASAERVLDRASVALGDAMLEVRYESLVREPKPMIRAMLEYAGLGFDERCLHPERTDRVVQTISRDQVTSAISARSVGRWERFGARVVPLREALVSAGVALG